MSISEAGRKVGRSKSTVICKVKQWNQMTSEIAEKGFLDSIAIKKGKGRPTIVKDEHTVFYTWLCYTFMLVIFNLSR